MPDPREIDVTHVAKLARLNLTAEETKLFQEQLGRVLDYAGKLREADTSGIEAADPDGRDTSAQRDDEPRSWLTADEALRNAPREASDLFIVPKVLE